MIRFLLPAILVCAGCGSSVHADRDTGPDTAEVVEDTHAGDVPDVSDTSDDTPEDVSPDTSDDTVPDTLDDAHDVTGEEPATSCTIDLGSFSPIETNATLYADGAFIDMYSSGGSSSFPFSMLDVESWFGYGGPRTPTTHTFDGTDTPDTCSLCMFYWENCDSSWVCENYYFAVSGTLVLSEWSDSPGDTAAGTGTDIVLEWFDFESGVTDPSRTVCVDSVSFSETLVWGG